MTSLIEAVTDPEALLATDPDFPNAPPGWTRETAREAAHDMGLVVLTAEHLDTIRALQDYWVRHRDTGIHLRELHDALDEKFHSRGGMRFLYVLFPGGPVAQGCRLAGLPVPSGAIDRGFGSAA
jgi:TusE/DsrC/DsvC family sulfur relay protein